MMTISPFGASTELIITGEDEMVKFELIDNGPGISESDQKNMFKPFHKLSARPTDGESSTGLGLSIIKVLVHQLQGEIEVQTELNKGSNFIVRLPSL